jgi:acetylornithine deacetylase/succinyl-diaminopimelate desuccinylase-like protein
MRYLLPFALLLGGCVSLPDSSPPLRPVDDAEMRATISVLASDAFEGRMAGTAGAGKAAAYIAERFDQAGVEPLPSGYLQAFEVNREPKHLPADHAKIPSGQRYFMAEQNRHGRFTAYNVVGRVPGRAPDGRVVVVMAHYDHLGICQPEGVPDRICNGAVDNASGTAALIAVAERVAEMRLDRDVWFVATSGEEWGLLGAKAFADKPPVPLASIIAGFNLDTIAIAGSGAPVAMVAPRGSALEPLVRGAAAAVGRAWDGDDQAAPFLKRQDGWALAERGVPMIMAGGSFSDLERLQAFLGKDYHAPSDELRPATELGGAVDDANLHVELVRRAASRSALPSFAPMPNLGGR